MSALHVRSDDRTISHADAQLESLLMGNRRAKRVEKAVPIVAAEEAQGLVELRHQSHVENGVADSQLPSLHSGHADLGVRRAGGRSSTGPAADRETREGEEDEVGAGFSSPAAPSWPPGT